MAVGSKLGLAAFAVLLSCTAPAAAAEHPVPLDKNTDSAKCLECHNNNDARTSGGAAAGGPHAFNWTHLLERRYEQNAVIAGPYGNDYTPISYVAGQGVNGPYALCAKCHAFGVQPVRNFAGDFSAEHKTSVNRLRPS